MEIREENERDYRAVQIVNESAFETPTEARLVTLLRKEAKPIISLVAEADGEVIGHIMFSPMSLEKHPQAKVIGLAPMAVLPAHQRKGIGSALVQAGLEKCRNLDYGAVIVLGHSEYYPRFGFVPASQYSISSEYEVPDNVFMAIELRSGYLAKYSGKARYHEVFNDL